MKIDVAELRKVPFLRADLLGNRSLTLPSYWDGTRWSGWVPQADGSLFEMHPIDCAEGSYVAREAARPDDMHVPFADFMWRRIGWSDVQHWKNALVEDVHQMAASLDKIGFFWTSRASLDESLRLRRFVATEIEYLLMLSRSAFDLLQEVMRAFWRHIELVDPDAQRRKGDLKKSFADMVMHGDRRLSAPEIAETRKIPLQLAEAYAAGGDRLEAVRKLRDAIVHQGKDAPVVFVTERGFSIPMDQPVFRDLPIWTDAYRDNERLVSLRPALAWMIIAAIDTCNVFAQTLGTIFQLPPDIAPDHHVFIRTVHARALLDTIAVLDGGSPWWSESG